jgi:hypothetical protein
MMSLEDLVRIQAEPATYECPRCLTEYTSYLAMDECCRAWEIGED